MAFSWYFCPHVLQYGYFAPLWGLWVSVLACRVESYFEDLDGLIYDAQCVVLIMQGEKFMVVGCF